MNISNSDMEISDLSDEDSCIFTEPFYRDTNSLKKTLQRNDSTTNFLACRCNPYTAVNFTKSVCLRCHNNITESEVPHEQLRENFNFVKSIPQSFLPGGSRFSRMKLDKSFVESLSGDGLSKFWLSNINEIDSHWYIDERAAVTSQGNFEYCITKKSLERKGIESSVSDISSHIAMNTCQNLIRSDVELPSDIKINKRTDFREHEINTENKRSRDPRLKQKSLNKKNIRNIKNTNTAKDKSVKQRLTNQKNYKDDHYNDPLKQKRCHFYLNGLSCSENCRSIHLFPKEDGIICKNFNKRKGCSREDKCYYLHKLVKPRGPKNKTKDSAIDHYAGRRCTEMLNSGPCQDLQCSLLHGFSRKEEISCEKQKNCKFSAHRNYKSNTNEKRLNSNTPSNNVQPPKILRNKTAKDATLENELDRTQRTQEKSNSHLEKSVCEAIVNNHVSNALHEFRLLNSLENNVLKNDKIVNAKSHCNGGEMLQDNYSTLVNKGDDKTPCDKSISKSAYSCDKTILVVDSSSATTSRNELGNNISDISNFPSNNNLQGSRNVDDSEEAQTSSSVEIHDDENESSSESDNEKPRYSGLGNLLSLLKPKETNVESANLNSAKTIPVDTSRDHSLLTASVNNAAGSSSLDSTPNINSAPSQNNGKQSCKNVNSSPNKNSDSRGSNDLLPEPREKLNEINSSENLKNPNRQNFTPVSVDSPSNNESKGKRQISLTNDTKKETSIASKSSSINIGGDCVTGSSGNKMNSVNISTEVSTSKNVSSKSKDLPFTCVRIPQKEISNVKKKLLKDLKIPKLSNKPSVEKTKIEQGDDTKEISSKTKMNSKTDCAEKKLKTLQLSTSNSLTTNKKSKKKDPDLNKTSFSKETEKQKLRLPVSHMDDKTKPKQIELNLSAGLSKEDSLPLKIEKQKPHLNGIVKNNDSKQTASSSSGSSGRIGETVENSGNIDKPSSTLALASGITSSPQRLKETTKVKSLPEVLPNSVINESENLNYESSKLANLPKNMSSQNKRISDFNNPSKPKHLEKPIPNSKVGKSLVTKSQIKNRSSELSETSVPATSTDNSQSFPKSQNRCEEPTDSTKLVTLDSRNATAADSKSLVNGNVSPVFEDTAANLEKSCKRKCRSSSSEYSSDTKVSKKDGEIILSRKRKHQSNFHTKNPSKRKRKDEPLTENKKEGLPLKANLSSDEKGNIKVVSPKSPDKGTLEPPSSVGQNRIYSNVNLGKENCSETLSVTNDDIEALKKMQPFNEKEKEIIDTAKIFLTIYKGSNYNRNHVLTEFADLCSKYDMEDIERDLSIQALDHNIRRFATVLFLRKCFSTIRFDIPLNEYIKTLDAMLELRTKPTK